MKLVRFFKVKWPRSWKVKSKAGQARQEHLKKSIPLKHGEWALNLHEMRAKAYWDMR